MMVHGSWLIAHGSWPEAAAALGTQSRAGPDPDRERGCGSPGPGGIWP